jgi:acyl carrier protein
VTTTTGAEELREQLRELIAGVLYCDLHEVGDDTTFTDLGLDSVLIVEFVADINRRYEVHESVDVLYQHDTLAKFAGYLAGRIGEPGSPAR